MKKRKKTIYQRVNDIVFNSDIEDLKNFTVKSISKKIGVSRTHLSRKYKFETGKNPGDFLRKRGQVIYLLLQHSHKPAPAPAPSTFFGKFA